MFRRKDLCPTPEMCHYAQEESVDGLPCEGCPEQYLDAYLNSADGQPILATVELDAAIQVGLKVGLEQIPYPQFVLLRQLVDQRNKFSIEDMERNRKH